MSRVRLVVAALAGLALVAAPAQPQSGDALLLKVGDEVRVEGEPIGCKVREIGGATYLDCRRAGRLKGTYSTLLGARDAKVARFRSRVTAKVVFEARHRGEARRCGVRR